MVDLLRTRNFALIELVTADGLSLNRDSTWCLCRRPNNDTLLHIYLTTTHLSRVRPGSHQTFIIDGIKKSLLSFLSLCTFFHPESMFIFVLFFCDIFFRRSVSPSLVLISFKNRFTIFTLVAFRLITVFLQYLEHIQIRVEVYSQFGMNGISVQASVPTSFINQVQH
jgi:hypothetical protein